MENVKNVLLHIKEEAQHSLANPNFIFNMLVHSLILFTILNAFFTFYVAKLSENAFKNELNHLIDAGVNTSVDDLKNNSNFTHKALLNSIPLDKLNINYSKVDSTVEAHNKGLLNSVWAFNITLWVCFIIGVLLVHNIYDLKIWDVLIENLFTFILVGIAEYIFFTQFALKFIPVEPSFITKQFLEKVKNILQ